MTDERIEVTGWFDDPSLLASGLNTWLEWKVEKLVDVKLHIIPNSKAPDSDKIITRYFAVIRYIPKKGMVN